MNTSIFATHRIVAGEFNAISDSRIKHIDGLSSSEKDLETLNKIKVTDYHMIDPSHGDKPIKKAIAQQLEEVFLSPFQNQQIPYLTSISWRNVLTERLL